MATFILFFYNKIRLTIIRTLVIKMTLELT